jgi:HEPN domain-containing protein
MLNIQKQIEYWQNGSLDDFETANILIKNKRYIHGLFFCHLSIEKIIKAVIVKETCEIPPKSHDLFFLSKKAHLELSDEKQMIFQILMKYQLEGRYPEYLPDIPLNNMVSDYLRQTNDLLKWFKGML